MPSALTLRLSALRAHARVLVAGLLMTALPHAYAASVAPPPEAREQQWRTLDQLSKEELADFDPRTSTPRDTTMPYIPAEPYPFQAPYTAEEMGYRASEFSHIGRWAQGLVDLYGVVTATGYVNQGVAVSFTEVTTRDGFVGYLHDVKPGDTYARWTMYNVFPPDDEGMQQLWLPYRTDMEKRTKMDYFIYTPQMRRVRRQPQPRRDQRFPDNAQTFDDILGRDPWELEWQVLGLDTLYETIRFPNTRPTITLNVPGKGFVETPTDSIRIMGDQYPFYRTDGGVDCWVVKATIKPDWLPDYNEKYLVMWLDKHYFFPLRIEKYAHDGHIITVESRFGDLVKKEFGEFGYAAVSTQYWNTEQDLIGYSMHDGMAPRAWSEEHRRMMFTPEFMRRQWIFEPIKTLALIHDPREWFLRPKIFPGKFPGDRNMTLQPDVQARVDAQEAAGHLVFETGASQTADSQPAP